jgi:hypothetical protein
VRPNADALCVFFLCLLTIPLYWDRLRGGRHLSRVDLVSQFFPNYTYLGEHLRSGDLPGWNPFVSGGVPFAGDPQSGWGYLPATVSFILLPPLTALQANYLIQVLVAGLSMFALARVTGMKGWGALTAAVAYQYGSIIDQLRSNNAMAQMTAWIPLALLGCEMALLARTIRGRALGWFAGALALSQMIVGWTGQGSAYSLLVVGSYVAFRSIFSASSARVALHIHLLRHLVDGAALMGFGLALSAAGLWIRIEVNRDTLIAGGNYDRAVGGVHNVHYLQPARLVALLLTPSRYYYVGGATLALACIAPFVARRRSWRVWFYLAILALDGSLVVLQGASIRRIIFLAPQFQTLHEHNLSASLVLFSAPLALLAGTTIDALARTRRSWRFLFGIAFVTVFIAAAIESWLRNHQIELDTNTKRMMTFIGILIGVYGFVVALPFNRLFSFARFGIFFLVIVCICWDPFGHTFGKTLAGRAIAMRPAEVFSVYSSKHDPGGPGEFLQDRMAERGPFRFFGYGPSIIAVKGPRRDTTYHGMFRESLVVELLFSRSMRLRLENIQGYNPSHNARYFDFLLAVNGELQNYHDANVLRTGVLSPLLRLMDVRYIIVGIGDEHEFPEIKQLEAKYPTVFQDETVKILEVTDGLPHAWIVHSATSGGRKDAFRGIQRPTFDPGREAIIEGSLPALALTQNLEAEQVQIVRYGEDSMELNATLSAPGIVVVSEMYARGWRAEVDGHSVDILPTDLILRGIPVPAGEHTIHLRYAPRAIPLGIAVTLVTALVLATLLLQPWRYWVPFVKAWKSFPNPWGPPSIASSALSDQLIQISSIQEYQLDRHPSDGDMSRERDSMQE